MKPLRLSIEGLHSFKKRQEIDFEQLSEAGLFGIFGKTGSGKSTVLDAITLALYGAVSRAASRTQGVLNSQLDKLEVSLTFAIGLGERRKVYRVERGFKRHKDKRDSIQTMVCRLIEVNPAKEMVIAENTNEVNRKVEEIIGLNMEDFTRSVVLPQGEFAKFLQLKEAERIRMLERVFALAEYGSKLTEKVKRERDRLALQLELVERSLQEQGEVTKEQLDEFQMKQRAVETELKRLNEATAAFERAFTAQRDLWLLQTELEQVTAKQNFHWQTRPEMELKRAILEQAALAQQALTYLENAQKAADELSVSREKLQTATAAYQNEAIRNQQVKADFAKVETLYFQKQPELVAKRTQVEGILTLEAEREARQEQYSRVTRELDRLSERLTDLQTKLAAAEGDHTTKEAERERLETAIKELVLNTGYKEQVLQGVDLEKDLERSRAERERLAAAAILQTREQSLTQQTLRKNSALLEELTAQVEQLQAQNAAHREQKPGDFESYAQRNQELNRMENLINRITAGEADLETAQGELAKLSAAMDGVKVAQGRFNLAVEQEEQNLQKLEGLRTRLTGEIRALEDKNLAAGLARALQAGKPCPVCGSRVHPHHAELKEDLLAGRQAKLAEVEAAIRLNREQLERFNRELFQCLIQMEQYQSHHDELQAKNSALKEQLVALKAEYSPAARAQTAVELKTAFLKDQEELTDYRRAIVAWDETNQRWQQELLSKKEALMDLANQVRLLKTQEEAGAQALLQISGEAQAVEQKLTEQQQRLQTLGQEVGVTSFQAEQERILSNERRVEELRESVAKLTTDLVLLTTALSNIRQEREEVGLKFQELTTTATNWVAEIAARDAKITAVTAGKNPRELLAALDDYLEKLARKYEWLKKGWETSQTTLQNLADQLGECRVKLEVCQEVSEQAVATLEREMREKGFAQEADLQAALRSQVEQTKLQAQLQEYEDAGRRYQHQIENLNRKIAGRTLTATQWEQAQATREEQLRDKERLVAEQAKNQAQLEDLQVRFVKVQQYQKERREVGARKAMVDEIVKLFQGDGFVAYIAEEHLRYILWDASRRLEFLTGGRYLLRLDDNKDFSVVDNTNGGIARPVSSLSGGETFLVSLSLALALSGKIQLNGRHPLEFFFLDEGFGTLDPQLLEVVMDSLEKLRREKMTIGVITHMPELRNRISRRLIVTGASPDGTGSLVRIEKA
jgi:exonuclease SbcC